MAAEVVWTRNLGLLFGASVYTFSIVLAVFLVGLAIGSGLAGWVGRQALGWSQVVAAVGVLWPFSATWVRPFSMRCRVSLPAVTIGSQPKIKSAEAMPTRVVQMSSWCSARCTCAQVAPPFCANPAES